MRTFRVTGAVWPKKGPMKGRKKYVTLIVEAKDYEHAEANFLRVNDGLIIDIEELDNNK